MADRTILHSDLNCFYASVEIMLDPSLRGKPMAVCGDQEERHGIVLAKSQEAKKAGIRTGMANIDAIRLCPGLIMLPPHYDQYMKYSVLTRKIYDDCTDIVEPFGIDECWLDITGSDGPETADKIRRRIRSELGLTVSVGVSFNKIFAKLGSDMKKPDAMTVISRGNFRTLVWPQPASAMMGIGTRTADKLRRRGCRTIGDIAAVGPSYLESWLGKDGLGIWICAAGEDPSPVIPGGRTAVEKSIGHGNTSMYDMTRNEEVWTMILDVSQEVGRRLHASRMEAGGIQLSVRNSKLINTQYQTQLLTPMHSFQLIAREAMKLFVERYRFDTGGPVRAITVRTINLIPDTTPLQTDLLDDYSVIDKENILSEEIDDLRRRFGDSIIMPARLLNSPLIGSQEAVSR